MNNILLAAVIIIILLLIINQEYFYATLITLVAIFAGQGSGGQNGSVVGSGKPPSSSAHPGIRPAKASDLDRVLVEEKRNYGADGWSYTPQQWEESISADDPLKKSIFRVYDDGNSWAYLEFTIFEKKKSGDSERGQRSDSERGQRSDSRGDQRSDSERGQGLYLTTFGGDMSGFDPLLNYAKEWAQSIGIHRCYTHLKNDWFDGKLADELTTRGFKYVGKGDNNVESGKWAMDLSALDEYDMPI